MPTWAAINSIETYSEALLYTLNDVLSKNDGKHNKISAGIVRREWKDEVFAARVGYNEAMRKRGVTKYITTPTHPANKITTSKFKFRIYEKKNRTTFPCGLFKCRDFFTAVKTFIVSPLSYTLYMYYVYISGGLWVFLFFDGRRKSVNSPVCNTIARNSRKDERAWYTHRKHSPPL